MVKIVVKKEGATQTCGKCGTDIICRMKDYGGNFAPTLQWQNFNGTAHFKTTDGKNYNCNVPEDNNAGQSAISTNQQTISTNPQTATTTNPQLTPNLISNSPSYVDIAIKETVENIEIRLQRIDEMIQAIFRYTVDQQLGKK